MTLSIAFPASGMPMAPLIQIALQINQGVRCRRFNLMIATRAAIIFGGSTSGYSPDNPVTIGPFLSNFNPKDTRVDSRLFGLLIVFFRRTITSRHSASSLGGEDVLLGKLVFFVRAVPSSNWIGIDDFDIALGS